MSNLITLLTILLSLSTITTGVKRRIHITDDLDDVIDDEEDEAWRQWGKKSVNTESDHPDFSDMKMTDIQAEIFKHNVGPVFGFVKLRLGIARTPEMVSEIGMKWTKLSRTGAIETKFMGVDLTTIMFTMENGQHSLQLKEFVLNQPEAYEIKMGDQVFRRPGDPPLEEVIENLHKEKNEAENSGLKMENEHEKDEL